MTSPHPKLEALKIAGSLPSMPQVLVQLLDLCHRAEVDLVAVGNLVAKDGALAAKILQLANSSFIGARSSFGDVNQAVVYLGVDTVKNLAVSISVTQVFRNLRTNGLLALDQFWYHAYVTALLGRRIARQTGFERPAEAYLACLLHDIGKLLLWMAFPGKYAPLLLQGIKTHNGKLVELEEDKLGINHCTAGGWLATSWQLEKLLGDAISLHHHDMEEMTQALPLARIVYLADILAHDPAGGTASQKAAKAMFALEEGVVQELTRDLDQEVLEVADTLGIKVTPPQDREGQEKQQTAPAQSRDQEVTPELVERVEDISRLTGLLENLLRAENQEQVLLILEQGLKILFSVDHSLVLLLNRDGMRLHGVCSQDNLLAGEVGRLCFRPDRYPGSLAYQVLDSGRPQAVAVAAEGGNTSLIDRQIGHILAVPFMAMVPLRYHRQPVGLLVLGLNQAGEHLLEGQARPLRLLAAQAAACLYIQSVHEQEAERRARARLEAARLMARKIAHEINNPLGIIRNYLSLQPWAQSESGKSDDLQTIDGELERIAGITRQLSDLGKESELRFERVDLGRLLEEVVRLRRGTLLPDSGLKIALSLAEDLPLVHTDPNRLRQIMINLLSNSVDALQDRGSIAVSAARSSLRPGQVEIMVVDDGPGIPAPVQARLFQAGMTTKSGGHAGLGLVIVQKLVQDLGGDLVWESSGKGTRFTIFLPISSEKAQA